MAWFTIPTTIVFLNKGREVSTAKSSLKPKSCSDTAGENIVNQSATPAYFSSRRSITKTLTIMEKTRTHKTMLESLSGSTPYQLLVATMLSARTKDSVTIPVVEHLFSLYPTPDQIASLPPRILEKLICRVGFHRTKTRHLLDLSKTIISKYGGICPSRFEELVSFAGVGRKTANCILSYVFNIPAIAVDVHVQRLSNRLGWVNTTTPQQTEQALERIVPKKHWGSINKLLVAHGQTICRPRRPLCSLCPITKNCRYYSVYTEKSRMPTPLVVG